MGRSREENVEGVEVPYDTVVTETDGAILFETAEGEVWIPRSQIKAQDEKARTFTIPEWLALEKCLA
jgi:hypothetical protein